MAVYDLEEQEQLEEIKTWWKLHGNRITTLALVVALAAVGWQGWNWWQRNQAAQASAIYMGLEKAAGERDIKRTRELAGELIDKFPRTTYAGMGALLSARVQVDGKDAKNARLQLQWAAENTRDQSLRDLARLRLAALLIDENSYDEALKQLAAEPGSAFSPRYAELKGDALAAQGKLAEARTAYDVALSGLEKQPRGQGEAAAMQSAYREMLQAKRDAMGSAK
ncbi:tetratricopeptide repeat protein [Denitratisoma oestradiolicum]|uniref:Ancillary SecYEG translocon subunit/Cell division coordinator CpoB TPR domain-containing protein n=1 Tax=Denitratisoma oestradiolicum TaxID=311182 RepID=A0A6S6YQA7_9PROT|nr:tetratricopeptide repeat protein [Denitratisoma oestradiolicum]TWO78995.1 hypothetical protein CBW56_17130 [Denitratisoma oestradiolicum]CAB1369952.1 conserved protein of unknown function [Denitratisoma oestradiolicum]